MEPEPVGRAAERAAHPLAADQVLVREVVELMQATIQKVVRLPGGVSPITLSDGRLAPRDGLTEERVLAGGTSVDDILQEAFLSLLRLDPDGVKSWKAMAYRVAHRRAVDAVRIATKGRRDSGTSDEDQDRITLTSVDILDPEADLAGSPDATEDEYLQTEQAIVLRRVARAVLAPRELPIFLEIHFGERARSELAKELGMTTARVGQLYRDCLVRVRAASSEHPAFSVTHSAEGRARDDR